MRIVRAVDVGGSPWDLFPWPPFTSDARTLVLPVFDWLVIRLRN
jgi:hypothetical protein